ncbi:hypothetical protein OHA84_36005 [Streptomyces sp. NBC_00513]|uniref:hypothetical protein n=1 Tax=unclassified Streptomyces TaxID=2593676 RepID=UPI0022571E19|nr:hypothetical protein [Streptomyces sp. NBC_00424]MCX5071092.1 hypothetical protein [Streptomyces sp. NBC_00424]WUD45484.1 hypothetical protein OHA84_36005 [Streptomyces sp. NBC_00513]
MTLRTEQTWHGSFFDRTRYVPEEAREQISGRLHSYLDEAAGFISRASDKAGLFLAGSLARSEAAVVQNSTGAYELASDLDFVLVVPSNDEESGLVQLLIDHLRRVDAGFLPTCFRVHEGHLHRVRSYFGNDLWHGARRPLRTRPGSPAPVRPPVGTQEAIEVVTHQLGNYLLLPEPGMRGAAVVRDSRVHQLRKLLLELLRATAPGIELRESRYADLLDAYTRPVGPVPAAVVSALVRARELSLANPFGPEEGHALVRHLLIALLGGDLGTNRRDGQLPSLLRERARRTDELLHLYQLCLIGHFFELFAEPVTAREAHRATTDILRKLDPGELFEARQAITRIQNTPDTPAALGDTLTLLRLDYYHYLGPYNFGRTDRPGYTTATRKATR